MRENVLRARAAAALGLLAILGPAEALCQVAPSPTPEAQATDQPMPIEGWALHAQATLLEQFHPAFRSPYRGPQSLDPGARGDETFDATIYGGLRLWSGAEAWVDGEIDQGFGISNTQGLAACTNGEAYKVGAEVPYVRIPHLFLRQTIGLGGAREGVAGDQNVLGGSQDRDRIVLTVDKYGVAARTVGEFRARAGGGDLLRLTCHLLCAGDCRLSVHQQLGLQPRSRADVGYRSAVTRAALTPRCASSRVCGLRGCLTQT